jgi:AcrR family transcriptional regulator
VTNPGDRRADSTRQQILRAAAVLFAERPYDVVSLDDIVADARISKGALYFHFRSKYALAAAIVEERTIVARGAFNELLSRRLSALESLIDITYLIAVQDITDHLARAALHLVESIGREGELQAKFFDAWIEGFTTIVGRAVAEGDITYEGDERDISRLLVSLYMGVRRTSNFDAPKQFLTDIERSWLMLLRNFANANRIDFLTQFVKRRTAVAISQIAPATDSS